MLQSWLEPMEFLVSWGSKVWKSILERMNVGFREE